MSAVENKQASISKKLYHRTPQFDDMRIGGQFYLIPNFIYDMWAERKISSCYFNLIQTILRNHKSFNPWRSYLEKLFSKDTLETYLPKLEKDGIVEVQMIGSRKIYHVRPFQDWIFPEAKQYADYIKKKRAQKGSSNSENDLSELIFDGVLNSGCEDVLNSGCEDVLKTVDIIIPTSNKTKLSNKGEELPPQDDHIDAIPEERIYDSKRMEDLEALADSLLAEEKIIKPKTTRTRNDVKSDLIKFCRQRNWKLAIAYSFLKWAKNHRWWSKHWSSITCLMNDKLVQGEPMLEQMIREACSQHAKLRMAILDFQRNYDFVLCP